MFGSKAKKSLPEMNEEAAIAFWGWFSEREGWIIECLEAGDAQFVSELAGKLKPVFPYYRRELEFQLGYGDGEGEFSLFHFGDELLERDGKRLGEMIPETLSSRWEFILDV